MNTFRLPIACLLLASAFTPFDVSTAHSQAADSPPKPAPYFLNLSPPVYPPLARQARIGGDVVLKIGVRPDGSVASAEVISGHSMLKQAALDSVKKSTFECESWSSGAFVVGCREGLAPLTVTYTFGFRDDPGDIGRCTVKRLRSARCLYLWRCGGWSVATPRGPVVGHSPDHVMILADTACVETDAAPVRGEKFCVLVGVGKLTNGNRPSHLHHLK